ncbi:hypothetical protein ABB37_05352 [Leptomonas pyrrhocoris]|uniref:Uncharacterized protein n=1 Tax=Leptomonas pyrrhocoris TaxID=157538 RepID=A0A0N0VF42_LEPPY|nr:hypothetical protein ABB37_05352 [Leptomonas pyrrhocoris]KPA79532.1 hypothetical protein ABB37_05352 [Leptomonas pyrrhocoris]|eukprot:XP_015657971.1 hypothetical protein ABB37_05352 [Leptomonas pyrrhocoris]
MLASSLRVNELLQAVVQGNLSAVMECVSPANVNYTDPQYRLSLVMWAVSLGRLPTVEVLLSRGASLSQLDRYGFSILHRAVWSADIPTIHMVLFQTPLATSASSSSPADKDCAQRSSRDLTWRPGAQRLVNTVHAPTGRTPVMLAAVRGHTGVVRFLLETCGADPFQRDHLGFAAIDLAALSGHLQMVRLFLQLAVAQNGDGCGDGAAYVFPSTQRSAEDYCEVAQTLPQRQRLFALNKILNANLAEASRVAAA